MASKSLRATYVAVAGVALLAGKSVFASTITGFIDTSPAFSPTNQSLDGTTYFNAPTSGPFPAAPLQVGKFDFSIPLGQSIVGATVSGNFGSNAIGSGTSQVDLFLNGLQVASCNAACEAASLSDDVAWTFTFSGAQLSSLASGHAILTAVQQSASQIVLDPTAMNIQTAPVPLPGAAWLFGSGLISLFRVMRRKASDRSH